MGAERGALFVDSALSDVCMRERGEKEKEPCKKKREKKKENQ